MLSLDAGGEVEGFSKEFLYREGILLCRGVFVRADELKHYIKHCFTFYIYIQIKNQWCHLGHNTRNTVPGNLTWLTFSNDVNNMGNPSERTPRSNNYVTVFPVSD